MLRELFLAVRGLSLVLSMFMACLASSASAAAPPEDPVGTWKLKCVCPDDKARNCIVAVSREETELKATYTVDGVERAAKGVQFKQGTLIVQVDGQYGGQTYGIIYKGKPSADKIKGTAHWKYGWVSGSFGFDGDRIAQEVAQAP